MKTLSLFFCIVAISAHADLCPEVVLKHEIDPSLTNEERIFLCGDPKVEEWKKIPKAQAEGYARSFLQARGYHQPTFSPAKEPGPLVIDPGPKTRVKEIVVTQSPIDLETDRLRYIRGEAFTPDILKRIEDAVRVKLRSSGYPCPVIEVQGYPEEARATVTVKAGEKLPFPVIAQDEVPGLEPGVLERYRPFEPRDDFNDELLKLTQNRVSESQIVFSNFFVVRCEPGKAAVIDHKVVSGGPRVVRMAVGANSVIGPVLKAEWLHARMGRKASNVRLGLRLSWKDQSFLTDSQLFVLGDASSHWRLAPSLSLSRTNEERVTTFQALGQVGLQFDADSSSFHYTVFAGPGSRFIQTLKGEGRSRTQVLSLNVSFEAMEHELELERDDPTRGMQVIVDNQTTVDGFFAPFPSHKLDARAIRYWSLRDYQPALLVFSFRTRAATTWTDDSHQSPLLLPANYRLYLGGMDNLRGFGRNEIPYDTGGGLTVLTGSPELRVDLPGIKNLYGVGFWDFGWLGTRTTSLMRTLYSSPGFGLYWKSPFGVLKGTFAHGIITHPEPGDGLETHWQFYASFGESL